LANTQYKYFFTCLNGNFVCQQLTIQMIDFNATNLAEQFMINV